MKKHVIILAIVSGVIWIGLWLAFSLIYGNWLWLFIFPITIPIITFAIVRLIIYIKKLRAKPEELFIEIDTKEAKKELKDYLMEDYFDMVIPEGEIVKHVGEADSERTPIFHLWGWSYCENQTVNLLMNLKTKKKGVIYDIEPMYVNITIDLEKLGEKPATYEEVQTIPQTSEFGQLTYKTVRRRQTREQKQKEETEKEIEEVEAI